MLSRSSHPWQRSLQQIPTDGDPKNVHTVEMNVVSRVLLFLSFVFPAAAEPGSYAIVSSASTTSDPAWQRVIEALEAKYPEAQKFTFADGEPEKTLGGLRKAHPKYTCFVAKPDEVSRKFVTQVHQLTRSYDEDPYADTLWGILTGFDAENALAIAATTEPLIVERVASGTEVALEKCTEGIWYCELNPGKVAQRNAGETAVISTGPPDSTFALARTITDYQSQLFITSGHATERDWQIGFTYRNGTFRSKAGRLFATNTKGEKLDIVSPNPKVYLPIGNCLMGHIDGPYAMALAWLKSAGVRQMIGYTVPTWYGYAGWGCLDYFLEQPGRYSFTEAFHANQHATIHRIESCSPSFSRMPLSDPNEAIKIRYEIADDSPARGLGLTAQDAKGLLFDRDAVAFYGDPGWNARMADGSCSYEQALDENDGVYTFSISPKLGTSSFEPVNMNGAQRGHRPFVAYFPQRIKDIKVVSGSDLNPTITDDFILVPNPGECDPDRDYQVTFTAKPVAER